MKFSIAWHQQCAENSRNSLEGRRADLAGRIASLKQDAVRLAIYEAQIKRAVDEGRDGFDSEKFGKKRTPKEQS